MGCEQCSIKKALAGYADGLRIICSLNLLIVQLGPSSPLGVNTHPLDAAKSQ